MIKKVLFIVFIVTIITNVNAQIVNIPDANFKNALLNTNCVDTDGFGGFDADADINNDGEIQVSEALLVTRLNVSNQNISSLVGIDAFSNVTHLYFNDNSITNSLNLSSLTSLTELECSANQLTSLDVSNLSSLLYLQITGNSLQSVNISGATNLQSFLAHQNQFTALDFQGFTNLRTVQCGDNQLTSLNLTGLTNLLYLICYNNNIVNLDVSDSASLIDLDCANNSINNLNITNLNSLTAMNVRDNNITQLDLGLITQIDALFCQNNQIQTLDVSNQSNLIVLECQNNALTNLTIGSLQNLESIKCGNNQLAQLELINLPSLLTLNASLNSLTNVEVSGALNLTELRCSANALTSLDVSALTNLQTIECEDNQLEFLILKNGIQETSIDFNNNPNITYVCADEDQFSTIQTLLDNYNYTNCVLNSYCSFVPGGEYYSVLGETRFDLNANGCDGSDELYPFIKVNLTTNTGVSTFISNSQGMYAIPLQQGNYTITPVLENIDYFTITPNSVSVDITNADVNQNFCIVADGNRNDLETVLIPLSQARPGFDSDYKLVYKNKGNIPASGNITLNFQDELMDVVVSNPNSNSQTINTLTWNYTNLLPFETRTINFSMNLNTPTDVVFPVNGGDVLDFIATVNPNNSDETPEDNIFTLNQTVVNSYDPNDKTCLEGTSITPNMVGRYLHYTIRFENTGTANAINVVVKDEIDISKFDVNTLIPINGSHDFRVEIKNNNEVEFIFENINLPFDDASNDGYITFKIKTLNTLQIGDIIENKAGIYFDFNFPIITNTTQTTIENDLARAEFNSSNFSVYPNPTKTYINIKSNASINNVAIYDINGKLLKKVNPINSPLAYKVNLNELSMGIYFIKIQTDSGIQIQKIIKE